MAAETEETALEFTPTWIVAGVCSLIVLLSLLAERGLHYLGKVCVISFLDSLGLLLATSMALIWVTDLYCRVLQTFKKKNQKPLFEALLKVKEGASISPPSLCFFFHLKIIKLDNDIDKKRWRWFFL
jgi:mlo protein